MSCCNKSKNKLIKTKDNLIIQEAPKSFVKNSRLPAGTKIKTCPVCFTRNTTSTCIVCGFKIK